MKHASTRYGDISRDGVRKRLLAVRIVVVAQHEAGNERHSGWAARPLTDIYERNNSEEQRKKEKCRHVQKQRKKRKGSQISIFGDNFQIWMVAVLYNQPHLL